MHDFKTNIFETLAFFYAYCRRANVLLFQ